MRVCHVSPHLPPDQGANAILPGQLGAWAGADGDEIHYVSHEPTQGRASREPLAGPVTMVPRRSRPGVLQRVLRLGSWQRVREIGAALDRTAASADLLHLHSNGLIVEAAAAWARRRGKPYVLTLYGTEIWHYRSRWPIDPFARAYRGASAVTFYSQRLRDRARTLGLDRSNLVVIYPPVPDTFRPQDAATREAWRREAGIAEPFLVLNVKRLHPLAAQDVLIDAVARLNHGRGDVRLVICGTGPLRQTLEARARDAGIGDRVTFTGLLANDDIARYAAMADVFALPSQLEALPTVAVEALACGTPVISTDHPGGEELHQIFGDDVLVVKRSDIDGLSKALADARARPQRVPEETLALVRERFGPAAVWAAYRTVYERAIAAGPTP
ncbi:MAG TPA: glycosyltransferase [Vicinamibacterales bacterium]|nr:glycosyltransferase [Vicinamibacterales bacterium]